MLHRLTGMMMMMALDVAEKRPDTVVTYRYLTLRGGLVLPVTLTLR